MKRKKVVEKLKECKGLVHSYYHGLSNAQTDKITADLQTALDFAIAAVKENKKLKEENEVLKSDYRDESLQILKDAKRNLYFSDADKNEMLTKQILCLKNENEALKKKVRDLERDLEYGDPDGWTM